MRGVRPRDRGFLLAFFLILAVGPGAYSQSANAQWEKAVMAVLAVNPSEGKFLKRATAFHVGEGMFYTNAHVVKGPLPAAYTEMYLASTTATRTRESWLGPAAVMCVHAWWRGVDGSQRAYPFDVAQLHVTSHSPLPPAISFSTTQPVLGMHLSIVGFAAASRAWPPKLYTATGRVSEVDLTAQTFTIQIESGFALEGSSGSPVLTDAHEVIGIVYARHGERDRSAADHIVAITTQGIQSGCH